LASIDSPEHSAPSRRDFLYIATGAVGAVGAALTVWPLIDQMNPDAAALALATVEVDISRIAAGQSLIVKWRGKPVVIRQRTPEEIEGVKAVPLDQLIDPIARNGNLPPDAPATDENRSAQSASGTAKGKEAWFVMVQICTHLGCVPLGQQGDYDGWFCPCHGSEYDAAGRVRRGPAPQNMEIPVYSFESDTKIKIG
jgi:ubiquinol-cytochrome c reductase iron-sulfur subunit